VIAVALALLLPPALVARRAARSWLHPGALFAGVWLLAAVLPLAVLGPARVSGQALGYIAGAVAVFTLGALAAAGRPQAVGPGRWEAAVGPGRWEAAVGPGRWEAAVGPGRWEAAVGPGRWEAAVGPGRRAAVAAGPRRRVAVSAPRLPRWVVGLGCAGALAAAVVAARAQGFDPAGLLSPRGVLEIGSGLSRARYLHGAGQPAVVPALLTAAYCAAIVGPVLRQTGAGGRWCGWAPTVALIPFAVATTERFVLILSAALATGATVAAKMLATGAVPGPTRRGVLLALGACTAMAVLFTGIAFVRIGSLDPRYAPVVEQKLGTYAFGYEAAFSGWLAQAQPLSAGAGPLRWGTASFAGAGLALGGVDSASRQQQRRYADYAAVGESGQTSNVYTALRGLLEDFGPAGAALVMFAAGSLAGAAYRRVLRSGSTTAAVLLAFGYAAILLSPVISVATFSTACLAVAGAGLLLRRAVTPA
jgi:hypothetical protein